MSEIETITKLATESIRMSFRLENIDSRLEMFDSSLESRIAFHVSRGEDAQVVLLESVQVLFRDTCMGVK